jgi:hypothetical protein
MESHWTYLNTYESWPCAVKDRLIRYRKSKWVWHRA